MEKRNEEEVEDEENRRLWRGRAWKRRKEMRKRKRRRRWLGSIRVYNHKHWVGMTLLLLFGRDSESP